MPTIGQISKRYVSPLDPMLDQRVIKDRMIDIQNDKSFMSFLTNMGGKKIFTPSQDAINSAVFHSFQNDALREVLSFTGATIVGSGTASLTVTVLPAASQNKLKVGDVLKLSTGGVVRVMTTPLVTSFTAVSVDGTNVTLTATDAASIIGTSYESGSQTVATTRWGTTKISNVVQVMRSALQITDIEMQNGIEIEVDGQFRILPYEALRLRDMHYLDFSATMLLGKLGTPRFSDASPTIAGANGNGIQFTRGIDQYITQYGIDDQVAALGTLALDDLADMITKIVANRSTSDYLIGCSTAIGIKFSNLLKNLPSSGAVNSARINVQGKEIDLDCTEFTYGGYKFYISNLGILNNAQIVGSGSTLITEAKCAYFMPLGQAKEVGGGMTPFMSYRYQAQPVGASANRTVNGMTEETRIGGLAPVATSQERTNTHTMTTTAGLDIYNPQAFGRMRINS